MTKKKTAMVDKICEWRNKPYQCERYLKDKRRYCSKICSNQWKAQVYHKEVPRRNTEKQIAAAKANLEKTRQSPAMLEYLHSDRNPFNDPAVRAKAHLTLAQQGYKHLTGGNGSLSVPQLLLYTQLQLLTKLTWSLEIPAKTIGKHYVIDIAHVDLKIAIEVDGNSHLTKERQRIDQEKDKFLTSTGWTIFRFTNSEVLKDSTLCVKKVHECIISKLE